MIKHFKKRFKFLRGGCILWQNNVLELWSLFDFLMPGFLGTERQVHISGVSLDLLNLFTEGSLSCVSWSLVRLVGKSVFMPHSSG